MYTVGGALCEERQGSKKVEELEVNACCSCESLQPKSVAEKKKEKTTGRINLQKRKMLLSLLSKGATSSTSASFIAPKEKLLCFTSIGQDELYKLITASKPTICLLDHVPTKLLIELLPVAE